MGIYRDLETKFKGCDCSNTGRVMELLESIGTIKDVQEQSDCVYIAYEGNVGDFSTGGHDFSTIATELFEKHKLRIQGCRYNNDNCQTQIWLRKVK